MDSHTSNRLSGYNGAIISALGRGDLKVARRSLANAGVLMRSIADKDAEWYRWRERFLASHHKLQGLPPGIDMVD